MGGDKQYTPQIACCAHLPFDSVLVSLSDEGVVLCAYEYRVLLDEPHPQVVQHSVVV